MANADRYEAWNRFYRLGDFAPQPKRKPKPKPPGLFAPPSPPDTRRYIDMLKPPKPRSEAEWDTLLDARTKPMTDSLEEWKRTALGASQGHFERGRLANESLSAVFMREITGGLQGEEAIAYAKANFGSSHFPAQIAALGVGQLNKLTAEWDERDWQISGQYLEKMQEIPQIRETLRAQINQEETDDYTRRFNQATLIMDELWRGYDKKQEAYNDNLDHKRADRAQAIARGQLLLSRAESARDFALAMTDITGYVYKPNPKDPSNPTKTNVVAPGSKAAAEANRVASDVADRAADAGADAADAAADAAKGRRDAVKAREDDFAQTRSYIFRDVKDMVVVPSKDELSAEQKLAVLNGTPIEQFARKPDYAEARQSLWDQHGESLMRYSSARGRSTLRKRINAMIDKALASIGVFPPAVVERMGD